MTGQRRNTERWACGMLNDAEKLLAIANFIYCEGIRVEDRLKITQSHRMVQYHDNDQLDMLEIIQLMDRLEYFNELSTVIDNPVRQARPQANLLPLDRSPLYWYNMNKPVERARVGFCVP